MPWIAPDDVLPRALQEICPAVTSTAPVFVLRDARGRLRVVLEKKSAVRDDVALQSALEARLGAWFAPPIVRGDKDGRPYQRIVSELRSRASHWPAAWPNTWIQADGTHATVPAILRGMTTLLSKESWLDEGTRARSAPPRVVTFYSFKGGVGRTTTLGCVARILTARGLRVAAVDLDLEAPGLGSFLDLAPTSVGVIDHVLSHLATGEVGEVEPLSVDGYDSLWCVPAGAMSEGYLEKLARLDFLSGIDAGGASPVEEALGALLARISDRIRPDVILLDGRAGLHDMGGLALHRLAHADILVARANKQARAGLAIVLDAIRRMRPDPDDRDLRIVQTMVPLPEEQEPGKTMVTEWREGMYDLCRETVYRGLDSEPALTDKVAHYPLVLGYHDALTRTDRVQSVPDAVLADFETLADFVAPSRDDED